MGGISTFSASSLGRRQSKKYFFASNSFAFRDSRGLATPRPHFRVSAFEFLI
jgi:hypothetical protein